MQIPNPESFIIIDNKNSVELVSKTINNEEGATEGCFIKNSKFERITKYRKNAMPGKIIGLIGDQFFDWIVIMHTLKQLTKIYSLEKWKISYNF